MQLANKMTIAGETVKFWEIVDRLEASDGIRPAGRSGWAAMPVELMVKIFEALPLHEVVRISRVCRKFRDVILASDTLQYRILCYTSGIVDGYPRIGDIRGRLSRLRAYRLAWKMLEGTIFEKNLRVRYNDASVITQESSDGKRLELYQIPSKLRGIEERSWLLHLPDETTLICHDHTQGLLVAMEVIISDDTDIIKLHLVSDETGEQHSFASLPHLILEDESLEEDGCDAAIAGDLLGLASRDEDAVETAWNHLWVWNWRTGELLQSLRGGFLWDVSFVDERHLIVPISMRFCEVPSIAVLDCFRRTYGGEGYILQHALDNAMLYLQLPHLYNGVKYSTIDIQSSSSAVQTSKITHHSTPAFHPSKESRLFVVTVTIESDGSLPWYQDDPISYVFAIPATVILSRLHAIKADHHAVYWPHILEDPADPRPVTVLPWSLWGHDARLLGEDVDVLSVCNSRCLIQEHATPDTEAPIVLYDFDSVPSLLHDIHTLRDSTEPLPFTIPKPLKLEQTLFETKVVPSAPCRRIVLDLCIKADDGVELLEDGLLVSPGNPDSPTRIISF